ncbi:hypothetical protein R3P38DRAFT_3190869 [Favolaschia claudopus]|uniref:Uncharacterized protein n=1 Tax=Favolaschia claudopus TaxID=2862362 RepID=A0AAW0BNA4_9AGAR
MEALWPSVGHIHLASPRVSDQSVSHPPNPSIDPCSPSVHSNSTFTPSPTIKTNTVPSPPLHLRLPVVPRTSATPLPLFAIFPLQTRGRGEEMLRSSLISPSPYFTAVVLRVATLYGQDGSRWSGRIDARRYDCDVEEGVVASTPPPSGVGGLRFPSLASRALHAHIQVSPTSSTLDKYRRNTFIFPLSPSTPLPPAYECSSLLHSTPPALPDLIPPSRRRILSRIPPSSQQRDHSPAHSASRADV